jgi:hypothetical protein
MRALKRRLSNLVYARMLADQNQHEAGPGGQPGTTTDSSVTDLTPDIGSSDKPHPGPAEHHRKPMLLATLDTKGGRCGCVRRRPGHVRGSCRSPLPSRGGDHHAHQIRSR